MPTIGEVVTRLEQELFVGRGRELAIFREWLAAGGLPEVLNVFGPGGVGKSAALHAFRRVALEQGRATIFLDGYDFRPTPDALLRELCALLGQPDRLEPIVAALNTSLPLLVLDTFELMTDLTPYLRDELLPRLDTRVKVVIAGRYPLGHAWSRHEMWRKLIRPLQLGGFAAAESRAYLERRGLSGRVVDQIVSATGGQPLALSLAADLARQFGERDFASAPEWRLVIRGLVERLLSDVADPVLRELLEACAVVREFDEATLAAVALRPDIGRAFNQLCGLSIVRAGEHGLMLHDDVRRILAEDLRWRNKDRYGELRLRALEYSRERMRTASPEQREWLLAERFYLWGNAVIQEVLFAEDEPGEVWMEPGRPEEHADLRRLFEFYVQHVFVAKQGDVQLDKSSADADLGYLESVWRYPGTRRRLARDRDGRMVGASMILPVCQESLPFIANNPTYAPLLHALWGPAELAALPTPPEASNIHYMILLAYTDIRPEAFRAALLRDMFGIFAQGGIYLWTVSLPFWKKLAEACGFQRVDVHIGVGTEEGATYVLDLTHVGVDAWMEALISGRPLPRALRPEELGQELQAALLHWRDDSWLAASPLASSLTVAGDTQAQWAEALRQAISDALTQARARASADEELAYRAVELAYLHKAASHEQVARQLAVSRTTFYRLLKRGVKGLAEALR